MTYHSYLEFHLENAIFKLESNLLEKEMILDLTMEKYGEEDSDIVSFFDLERILYLESKKWPSPITRLSINAKNFGIQNVEELQDFMIGVMNTTVSIKQDWKFINA